MKLEAFQELKEALAAFVKEVRDKLEEAESEVDRAKDMAQDAFGDAMKAAAPAMGPGPLQNLEAAMHCVTDCLGDVATAIEQARDACYSDFDFAEDAEDLEE
jgi:hypothetical protein